MHFTEPTQEEMIMSKTFDLDQLKLFTDICAAIAKQKKVPADNRANAVIKAANDIVAAYKMTNEEYKEANQ